MFSKQCTAFKVLSFITIPQKNKSIAKGESHKVLFNPVIENCHMHLHTSGFLSVYRTLIYNTFRNVSSPQFSRGSKSSFCMRGWPFRELIMIFSKSAHSHIHYCATPPTTHFKIKAVLFLSSIYLGMFPQRAKFFAELKVQKFNHERRSMLCVSRLLKSYVPFDGVLSQLWKPAESRLGTCFSYSSLFTATRRNLKTTYSQTYRTFFLWQTYSPIRQRGYKPNLSKEDALKM